MSVTLAERMARYLRVDVQGMHGYAVQPSAGLVKLDTMENPFGLPPELRRALGERLVEVALNRYPAERGDVLRAELSRHARLPEACALMLGNGSDEIISLLTLACATHMAGGPRQTVLAPLPGFVMYEMSAKLLGLNFVGVPTTADFELDGDAMLAAIRRHQPALVWLAYPNNPTANLWSDADLDAIIEAAPGLVVMDEAYQPFAARDSLARLQRHEHVLIMRTMSKFGLAGVRIGYLMGREALLAEVDKLRPPFNVSVLNAEAALFALEHADEYARQAAVIRSERERVFHALAAMPAVHAFASEANMLLARVPDPKAVFEGMRKRGVLIKNIAGLHPLLHGCVRITIGTPDENTQMLAAFASALQDPSLSPSTSP
jgi:histidinol-phosphate aminotransferase